MSKPALKPMTASDFIFPFEVRYFSETWEECLWSRHKTREAAERCLREPFNQMKAKSVFIADIVQDIAFSCKFSG